MRQRINGELKVNYAITSIRCHKSIGIIAGGCVAHKSIALAYRPRNGYTWLRKHYQRKIHYAIATIAVAKSIDKITSHRMTVVTGAIANSLGSTGTGYSRQNRKGKCYNTVAAS